MRNVIRTTLPQWPLLATANQNPLKHGAADGHSYYLKVLKVALDSTYIAFALHTNEHPSLSIHIACCRFKHRYYASVHSDAASCFCSRLYQRGRIKKAPKLLASALVTRTYTVGVKQSIFESILRSSTLITRLSVHI